MAGLALVLVVGCTPAVDTAGPPAATPPSASSTSPAAPVSPAATPASAPPTASSRASDSPELKPAADVTVTIGILGGRVEPNGAKVNVERGQRVQIIATSDVVDSLHVHGYDHYLDVAPGKPAELIFTADRSGVFEIETHETAKVVARLVVR